MKSSKETISNQVQRLKARLALANEEMKKIKKEIKHMERDLKKL